MKKNCSRFFPGLTLIETVIYSALIAVILGGSLGVIYEVLRGADWLTNEIMKEQELSFIFGKVGWSLNNPQSLLAPVQNSTSSVLILEKRNFSQNPIVINLENDAVMMKFGSDQAWPLNHGQIPVGSLTFGRESFATTAAEVLKVKLTLDGREYETYFHLK